MLSVISKLTIQLIEALLKTPLIRVTSVPLIPYALVILRKFFNRLHLFTN